MVSIAKFCHVQFEPNGLAYVVFGLVGGEGVRWRKEGNCEVKEEDFHDF